MRFTLKLVRRGPKFLAGMQVWRRVQCWRGVRFQLLLVTLRCNPSLRRPGDRREMLNLTTVDIIVWRLDIEYCIGLVSCSGGHSGSYQTRPDQTNVWLSLTHTFANNWEGRSLPCPVYPGRIIYFTKNDH